MAIESNGPSRADIAEQSQLQTVGENQFIVSSDTLPWLNSAQAINTRTVSCPYGEFDFGNIIGASDKLRKIAETVMQGRQKEDDRLNRVMYDSIQQILSGNPGAVKRFKNTPPGVDIYYGGLSTGARIYFVDMGTGDQGRRTFLKSAICGSKKSEPIILNTLSGNKNEKAV